MRPIYLDHAAATPVDQRVLAAMQPYFAEKFHNPSALYLAAKSVAADLAQARRSVAGHFGCRSTEVIFTAGGTEANNLAVHGIMQSHPDGKLIVSAIEHDSVLEPARQYACSTTPVTSEGLVDLPGLRCLIDDDTVLVSLMYANNEIGTIQPVREVARLIQAVRADRQGRGVHRPLYLHTDAAQAGNYLDLHVSRLAVDLMTVNGGKLYGPKQSGALYVRAGLPVAPLIHGGGQERNVRSGTENVAAIIGFAKALEIASEMRQQEAARLRELQGYCIKKLQAQIPGLVVNGTLSRRLPNNVHITLPGQDNERLIMALDEAGIMAAAGSACSASKEVSSHVLLALGLTDEQAGSSLRFSLGRGTAGADIDRLVAELVRLVA